VHDAAGWVWKAVALRYDIIGAISCCGIYCLTGFTGHKLQMVWNGCSGQFRSLGCKGTGSTGQHDKIPWTVELEVRGPT
jgi:hypothetical protein